MKDANSKNPMLCIFTPVYVSSRQRKYGLRQGAK
jgi:hypothetical protein